MNAANTVNAGVQIARFKKLLLSYDSLLNGYYDLKIGFKETIKEAESMEEKRKINKELRPYIMKLDAKIELLKDLKRNQ